MEGLISIVIPLYNLERYIAETIDSIMKQSYPNFEVIIVNDQSTDHSLQIAQGYADRFSKVELISLDKNSGASAAMNKGMEKAKGKYLTFIAADDLLRHDRFEKIVNIFKSKPDIDIICSGCSLIDSEGNNLNRNYYFPPHLNNNNILLNELKRNYILGGTLALRRKMGQRYKYDRNLRTSEDYDLFLRMVYDGHKFYYIDEPLIKYRIHSSNKSTNYDKTMISTKKILKKFSFCKLYDKLKKKGCYDKEIFNSFAVVSLLKRDFEQGIFYIEKAINKEGNPVDQLESYFYAGVLFFKKNNIKQSEENFKKALIINPKEPTIYNNLGVILAPKDRYQAESHFKEALAYQPNYMDAQHNLLQLKEGSKSDKLTEKLLRKRVVHTESMKR